MKVVKKYSTTLFRNGRGRRECWLATSADGAWRFERVEDVSTPWRIIHVPTGTDYGSATSLPKAIREAERLAAAGIPKVGPDVTAEYPRWSVRRITNHPLRKFTAFAGLHRHRRRSVGARVAHGAHDRARGAGGVSDVGRKRRNDLAAQGIEVRTVVRDNVLGVETADALGNVAWVPTTDWYAKEDS